jgi:hypothetical protein
MHTSEVISCTITVRKGSGAALGLSSNFNLPVYSVSGSSDVSLPHSVTAIYLDLAWLPLPWPLPCSRSPPVLAALPSYCGLKSSWSTVFPLQPSCWRARLRQRYIHHFCAYQRSYLLRRDRSRSHGPNCCLVHCFFYGTYVWIFRKITDKPNFERCI